MTTNSSLRTPSPGHTPSPGSADTSCRNSAPPSGRSLLQALEEMQASTGNNSLSLRDLCNGLGTRAIAAPLLICALPCCLPFLYGVPQVMALPMLLLAGQIALGSKYLWLPEKLGQRQIKPETLQRTIKHIRKPLQWLETISHPRLIPLTAATGQKITGAFLFLFCLCVLIPLPMTNTVPGFAVALTTFGLIERDGILSLIGMLLGSLWTLFLIAAAALALGTGGEWLARLMGG